MEVAFLTPLGGATGLVILVAALAALMRERGANRLREAVGLRAPGVRARLPSLLGASAVALLALAAAQPVLDDVRTSRARNDAEVVFTLDRSRSMLAAAAPGAPGRFERAVDLSVRLRSALADVPAGAASIGEAALPHLFPSNDVTAFELVVRGAMGVERPPPVGKPELLATDLEEIGDLATDGYFSPDARHRLAIVLTDGESEPFSATRVAAELRDDAVGLVVVRLGSDRERIYAGAGVPEAYRPNERSADDLAHLVTESGGRVYREAESEAVVRAARRLLGVGPTAVARPSEHRIPLAPYAVVAALALLAPLFVRPRRSRLTH